MMGGNVRARENSLKKAGIEALDSPWIFTVRPMMNTQYIDDSIEKASRRSMNVIGVPQSSVSVGTGMQRDESHHVCHPGATFLTER